MKRFIPWLILGLLLRLFVIPLTLHADFRAYNLAAYLIVQKGQLLTFYDYLSHLPRTDRLLEVFMDDGLFIYPPLAYLVHAAPMWLFNKVYPWDTLNILISYYDHVRPYTDLPSLLYLLKAPYLVVDFIGFLLLTSLFSDRRKQLLAGLLWIFNPITIYATYMVAQFDIYIAVFLLGVVWLWQRHRPHLAAIVLGVAAGFKPFPLLLAPLLGNSLSQKIKLTSISLCTYLLIISPYLTSPGFKQYALLANQTEKLWYAQIAISGGQYLPLFLVGLGLIFWFNYYRFKSMSIAGWFTAALLLFYSVVHYHIQWFVWVTPLLILTAVSIQKTVFPMVVLLLCYLFLVLFAESTLTSGLFGSSFSLTTFASPYFVPDQFLSLVRGIFAATSLYLIALLSDSQTHE